VSAEDDRPTARSFRRAGHPIFVIDPGRGTLRFANCSACSLLGYDVDELLALSVSEIFLDEGRALEGFLEGIVDRSDGLTTVLGLRTKSGAVLTAELLAFRFRSDGQPFVLVLAKPPDLAPSRA
jgi:PAS domain S-box-containing protein